jgi:hypothetical protein
MLASSIQPRTPNPGRGVAGPLYIPLTRPNTRNGPSANQAIAAKQVAPN